MAKPHCEKHKRYVPYCDDCKAVVKAAEEAELQAERDALAESPEAEEEDARAKQAMLEDSLREEESNALQEGVGFPGAPAKTEEPVEEDGPVVMGGMFPPEESPDWDKEIDQAEETFREGENEPPAEREIPPDDVEDLPGGLSRDAIKEGVKAVNEGRITPADEVFADIDETEAVMTEAGEFDIPPAVEIDEGQPDTPWNPEAIAEYTDELAEKLKQEGRKEVIAMVREWFSDSIDTGAFQLLAHLERRCR